VEQKLSIKIVNISFEDVTEFKYLGIIVTDQNFMHEEIKSRQSLVNACYHLVQSLNAEHINTFCVQHT
jgi:hypothetical protein